MKIAHILWAPKIGGAELFALRLAREQAKQHDVAVLYLGAGDNEIDGDWSDSVKALGFSFRSAYDLIGGFKLIRTLRKQKYDVIHQHQSPSVLPFVRAGAPRALIVKHEHGRSSVSARSRRQRFAGYLMKVFVDGYIANSEYTRQQIIATEGIPSEKITVVCGGVDLTSFQTDSGDKSLRVELGFGDQSLVLFLGRLVWEKGVDEFLAAAEQIYRALPDSRFLIVGNGPLREDVQSRIEKMGLGQVVSLLGFRDDVPRIMKDCDLFLMTSRQEAQGLTVLEAMAAGVPVVSFDTGGLPEIVGDAGITIEDRSIQDMASTSVKILTNAEFRGEMARCGLQHVRKYSFPEVSARITSNYRSLKPRLDIASGEH